MALALSVVTEPMKCGLRTLVMASPTIPESSLGSMFSVGTTVGPTVSIVNVSWLPSVEPSALVALASIVNVPSVGFCVGELEGERTGDGVAGRDDGRAERVAVAVEQLDRHARIGHPDEVGIDDVGEVVALHPGVIRGQHRQVRRGVRARGLDREVHDRAEGRALEVGRLGLDGELAERARRVGELEGERTVGALKTGPAI